MQTELNPLPSSLFHLNTLSRRFNSSRRNMWGNCWCGNVLRLQHAVGIQSEGTVAHSVSSSSLANCFTETLRGFKTAMGLVGFGWTLLPLFRGFPPTVALFSCQQIRSKVPLYNSHFKCACVSLCHRCALLCVCCFHVKTLWHTGWGSAAIYKLKGSCDLLALHPAMFSDQSHWSQPRSVASTNN